MIKEDHDIIENLIKMGFANKFLNRDAFYELYDSYKKQMSDVEFAKLLGVRYNNFQNMKNRGKRVKILKREKNSCKEKEITQDRREEIIEELKSKGYDDKAIDYKEFLMIYNQYQNEMTEREFADLLGVKYGNYRNLKTQGTRAKILKKQKPEEKEITQERKEEIIKELEKKGYINKIIDYKEFLEMYESYQNEIAEEQFANLLGVKLSNYNKIKTQGTRVKILKEKKPKEKELTQERKQKIIEELKKNGYIKKSIDYKEFLAIYESYKNEMNEVQFANLLGVREDNYRSLKNQGTRVKILKEKKPNEKEITEERKEEIGQNLKSKGYNNKSIDYKEFLAMYEPYKKEMTEIQFANLLGIKDCIYRCVKTQGKRVKILKDKIPEGKEITDERKKSIEQNLKERNYTNKLIDYKEFLAMYETYKEEMTEMQFADVLGINKANFKKLQKHERKTRILKEEERKVTEARKELIIQVLNKEGYTNKCIDYKEFLAMYETYKEEMTEMQFADILGINKTQFKRIKEQEGKTNILKEKSKKPKEKVTEEKTITEKRKEEIIEELKEKGCTYNIIGYKEFLELYGVYKNEMTEKEFASLLGVRDGNYFRMKNNGTRIKINFIKNEIDRIKYQLNSENRYYTKDELEKLCIKYKITLKELMFNLYKTQIYMETLNQKGKIYIGSCKMDKSFQEKYAIELMNMTKSISINISKNFSHLKGRTDDIASDTLMWLIEKRGDVILNNLNDESALDCLRFLAITYIKNEYLTYTSVNKRNLSLDEKISNTSKSTRYIYVKSKENIEEIVEQHNMQDYQEIEGNVIISEIEMCYNNGMNNKDAIEAVTIKYGIPKKYLLKVVEEELTKRRKIVKGSDGKIYLGEEL